MFHSYIHTHSFNLGAFLKHLIIQNELKHLYLSKTESFDGHYHVVKHLEIMADIFRNDALGENFPFNFEVYPFTNMISSLIPYMGISSACPFSQRKESSGFQCTMNQRKAHG